MSRPHREGDRMAPVSRATDPRQFPLRPYSPRQFPLHPYRLRHYLLPRLPAHVQVWTGSQGARLISVLGVERRGESTRRRQKFAQPGRDQRFLLSPMKRLAIATPSGAAVFRSDLSSEFGLGGAGSVGDTSRESPRCPLRAMAFCLRGRAASATAPATVATIATPTPITTAGCFLM